MKIEEIIEEINRHIEDKRNLDNISANGHLVLHKLVVPNPTFKTYKTYRYTVWFVDGNKKYRVLSVEYTFNSNNTTSEEASDTMDMKLFSLLYNWKGSRSYNEILTGVYNEDIDKKEV